MNEPKVRELKRSELNWERQLHRKAEIDINRAGLGEMLQEVQEIENLACQEIKGLASRIKRRKHADVKDLLKLSYGFQQSAENISTFLRITGSINVIVKELTGQSSDLQQLAGECLCNLTLGDEVCCEKVATFAGTYLMTFLENLNNRPLNCTCIWTLQNIISSGTKAMKVLHSQGIVARFIHLLAETGYDELYAEILLAIDLILEYGFDFISEETILTKLLPIISSKKPQPSSLKVLYKSLFLVRFETIEPSTLQLITSHSVDSLALLLVMNAHTDHCVETVLAVRILANLIAKNDVTYCDMLLSECQQRNVNLTDVFNVNSKAGHVQICKELLWFLGNLQKAVNQHKPELHNLFQSLNVPKLLC
ncbi:uncharacterized protein LOC131684272 [Topomyia yanbarensis]|uniref:uncharacterized protein LOC131684272 n=1 Tax=Topomyia yanbarensis TaxID=2498891 RepID=UPI00273B9555|nr:uncharacterized protein LOC131684272 [Topomyia yanbarensis]